MVTTIKDIAKILKVSPSTVSRVLRKNTGASEDTKKGILELSKLLNYKPNPIAQSLVSKQTRIINIVIPQTSEFVFSNPFYSEILKGIGIGANARKYYLFISLFQEMSFQEFDPLPFVSGVLVFSNRLGDEQVLKERLHDLPTVVIPGFLTEDGFSSVDFDNLNGARVAAEYLLNIGHRRVAFITGPQNAKHSILREKGFREAFQERNLFLDESLIVRGDFSEKNGARCMEELLNYPSPPTAVVCVNDVTAIGALWKARQKGVVVPNDVSIVGFGDIPWVGLLNPPLTTIHEPFVELGQKAINLLIDLIERKGICKENIILPVELVIRGSSAPLGTNEV